MRFHSFLFISLVSLWVVIAGSLIFSHFISSHFSKESCITGTFEVSQWDGDARLVVGNQSICGINLHFTSISGPVRQTGD